jgi:hypothetical protein
MSKKETANVLVRLPLDVDDFIREQAERSLSSRSSEIVRTIRQRMDAAEQSKKAG